MVPACMYAWIKSFFFPFFFLLGWADWVFVFLFMLIPIFLPLVTDPSDGDREEVEWSGVA